jgi:hypothetical protein
MRLGSAVVLLCTLGLLGCDGSSGRPSADGGTKEVREPAQPVGDGGLAAADGAVDVRDDGTCDVAAHCAPGAPCELPVCIAHKCSYARKPAGTLLDAQTAGDCTQLKCDAAGEIEIVVDASDTPKDDGDPCTLESCQGAQPAHLPAPLGTPLPDDAQVSGDCKELRCDAMQEIAVIAAPSDLPRSSDPCSLPACQGPNPSSTPASAGAGCGGSSVCDGAGLCIACLPAHGSCKEGWQCCGGICDAGGCVDTLCRAGARYCRENSLYSCSADGAVEHIEEACGGDAYCDEASLACRAYLCPASAPVCDGEVATRCTADRKGYEPGGTDCTAMGKRCAAGACVDGASIDVVAIQSLGEAAIGPVGELNGFKTSVARTLTELEVYLRVEADTSVTFLVYEGTSSVSLTKIAQRVVTAKAGQGYVSSGAWSVELKADHEYAIGIGWSGQVATTELDASAPVLSFGTYLGFYSMQAVAPSSISVSVFGVGGWTTGLVGQRIHTSP